ncbi:MAG TPA: hypothetical protein PKD85_11245, partial [Saprospiraceae bacterium]|nr:hypothetical protein [Saprospiraceae bacterium]
MEVNHYIYSYLSKSLNKIDNFSKNPEVQLEPIRDIKMHKGNFYGLGYENSFFVINKNGQILHSQQPDNKDNGLPLGRGRNVCIDTNGTVILVHNKGVSITNLHRNFINKKSNFNLGSAVFDPYISGISSVGKDELYINTFNGLLRWNSKTNSSMLFDGTKLDGQFMSGGNLVYKDKIIFTNFTNTIKVFNTSGKLLKTITLSNLPDITKIYYWKDNLGYLGTDDGLFIINLDDLSIVSSTILPNLEKIKGRINDVLVDQDWLYAATSYGVGFVKYNLINYELQLYNEEIGMLSNRTYSVTKDMKKNIYVATRMGVNIISPDNKLSSITKKSGLKFDRVENLLADKLGNIWITNNSLIFKYNPETKIISSFDQFLVGVPLSFNIGSKTILNDSLIVFGGSEGLVYFPYDQIMDDNLPLSSAIKIKGSDNQAMYIKDDHTLYLPYDKSFLSLVMIVNDMMINDKCFYRYKIADTWSMCSKNRDLLLDLKPGDYTFEFEFSLDERNWKKSHINLNIVVGPPFWQTKWFFFLCFGFLGLFSYALYRYKITKLLAVEQVRIKIASDLHDDVASTVGSISFYAEFAKSMVESNNVQLIN